MKLNQILQNNGLSERESAVYLSLLKLGEASAYQIGNDVGYNRPTVYTTLEKLREKNLILKRTHSGTQLFTAKDPNTYVDQLKQNVLEIESILPQLMTLAATTQTSDVLYFEGRDGYQHAVKISDEYFVGKSIFVFYAYSPDIVEEKFMDTLNTRLDRLGKQGTHIRGIVPHHTQAYTYLETMFANKYGWEFKYLPLSQYAPLSSLTISDDIIEFISRQKQQYTIIKNSDIANLCKFIFELAWLGADQIEQESLSKISSHK